MKAIKQLGIWMDHSHAHIVANENDINNCKTIDRGGIDHGDHHNSEKGEHQINNKQNKEQKIFYSKLADIIKSYDEVLLFGPTEAKTELLHSVREDHHFANIKIHVKAADKMTENQKHAFVKDHFKTAIF